MSISSSVPLLAFSFSKGNDLIHLSQYSAGGISKCLSWCFLQRFSIKRIFHNLNCGFVMTLYWCLPGGGGSVTQRSSYSRLKVLSSHWAFSNKHKFWYVSALDPQTSEIGSSLQSFWQGLTPLPISGGSTRHDTWSFNSITYECNCSSEATIIVYFQSAPLTWIVFTSSRQKVKKVYLSNSLVLQTIFVWSRCY
jgi:hypothetical protein